MVQFSLFEFLLGLAALGASLALAVGVTPLRRRYDTNFGPVGPNEPILATIGGQRLIAFFVPERGSCAVNTIMWKDAGADAPYASSRVRLSLRPGEMVGFARRARVDEPALRRRRLDPCARGPAELMLTGTSAKN